MSPNRCTNLSPTLQVCPSVPSVIFVYERCNCNALFRKVISALDSDIAKATKAAGGDAAILQSESNMISQVYSKTYNDGDVRTFADETHKSRYLVVKYVPDTPPAQQ